MLFKKVILSLTITASSVTLYGCDKIFEILSITIREKQLDVKPQLIQAQEISKPAETMNNYFNFEINLESPDQALKTWWRYLDAVQKADFKTCQSNREITSKLAHFDVTKISSGNVQQYIKDSQNKMRCNFTTYEREIMEVKTESQTRAIVFAKIVNITPPTEPLTEKEREQKLKGDKFKYLLKRSADGWKVAQVYRYSETNKILNRDVWEKDYGTYTGGVKSIFVLDSQ